MTKKMHPFRRQDNLPKVGLFDLNKKMPIMDRFIETAVYFEQNGHYPYYIPTKEYRESLDDTPGSKFRQFWDRERDRCRNGMKIGSTYITGDFYHYLNYVRIKKLKDLTEKEQKILMEGGKIAKEGEWGFPDPWDSSWHAHNYLEEAKRNGLHGYVLKSRGLGFTYTFVGMATNRYYHKEGGGRVYVLAPEDTFLTDNDAILYRIWQQMDFEDKYTPFFKLRQGGKANTSLSRVAKISSKKQDDIGGTSHDQVSFIQGLIIKDPKKFRGKRCDLMIIDEGGLNRYITSIVSVALRSLEQNNAVYGQYVTAGTGGTKLVDLAGFTSMFNNPEAFNILGIENIFSKLPTTKKCGLFLGAYWNYTGYQDSHGRSDLVGAYRNELRIRERKREISGPESETYKFHLSENAMHPEEALENVHSSTMPRDKLNGRLEKISIRKPKLKVGRMELSKNNKVATFIEDKSMNIIDEFPLPEGVFRKGAVAIRNEPKKGITYIAGIDPYAQDDADKGSHGCIYILNTLTDEIEAEYVGRPERSSFFLRTCAALMLYYNNAIALIENDNAEFNSFFRSLNLYNLLAPMPSIVRSIIPNTRSKRKRGMHKVMKVYNQTIVWIIDWLLSKPVWADEDDTTTTYIDTIDFKGLILELLLHEEDLNFDRLNALSQLFLLRQEYNTKLALQVHDTSIAETEQEFAELMANFKLT